MQIDIFTDGSTRPKNPGFGGAASVVIFNECVFVTSCNLGSEVTNNFTELSAIKQSLRNLQEFVGPGDYSVTIYSDSRYSLNVIAGQLNSRENLDLVEDIKNLLSPLKPNITLKWIRAHRSLNTEDPSVRRLIYWNNVVDLLAKEGSAKSFGFKQTHVYSESDFIESFKNYKRELKNV